MKNFDVTAINMTSGCYEDIQDIQNQNMPWLTRHYKFDIRANDEDVLFKVSISIYDLSNKEVGCIIHIGEEEARLSQEARKLCAPLEAKIARAFLANKGEMEALFDILEEQFVNVAEQYLTLESGNDKE